MLLMSQTLSTNKKLTYLHITITYFCKQSILQYFQHTLLVEIRKLYY